MPGKNGATGPKMKSLRKTVELRAEIARLARFGLSSIQIAKRLPPELAVSQQRVHTIIQETLAEYRRMTVRDTNELVQEKLQQWQDLRAEAYAAFEESRKNAEKTIEEQALKTQFKNVNGRKVPAGERMKITKLVKQLEGRLPANEYLNTIAVCLREEQKLQGLIDDRPVNMNVMNLDWGALAAKPQNVVDPLADALKTLPPADNPAVETPPEPVNETQHS